MAIEFGTNFDGVRRVRVAREPALASGREPRFEAVPLANRRSRERQHPKPTVEAEVDEAGTRQEVVGLRVERGERGGSERFVPDAFAEEQPSTAPQPRA